MKDMERVALAAKEYARDLATLVRVHEELAAGRETHAQALEGFRPVLDYLRAEGPWIQTRSGRCYPLLAPIPDDVALEDVAYALASMPRYTGHAQRSDEGHSYTIAQHSVLVSYIVPHEDALAGLMHDAAEAYCGDMSSPMKRCVRDFAPVERISYLAIARRFGMPLELPGSVKHADLVMLATEKRDLMVREPKAWLPLPDPVDASIDIWPAAKAEAEFLRRFEELTEHGERGGRVVSLVQRFLGRRTA